MNSWPLSLRFFWAVVKHKWFFLQSGLALKVEPRRLISHDWSKFRPSIARGMRLLFKTQRSPREDRKLKLAIMRHKHQEAHHWEAWVEVTTTASVPVRIPDPIVREMVADWLAASRAYSGKWPQSQKAWKWYNETYDKILLHPDTHCLVKVLLSKWFMS